MAKTDLKRVTKYYFNELFLSRESEINENVVATTELKKKNVCPTS